MLKIKNLIIITASIFFFLLLVAILTGNSLFSAILKAFFSSLVFSCIITIAGIILKKIIPELESFNTDIGSEEGGHLNIVLDEENPHQTANKDSIGETTIDLDSENEEDLSRKEFVEEVEEEAIGDISALAPENGDDIIEVMTEDEAGSGLPAIDSSDMFGNDGNFGNRMENLFGKSDKAISSLGIDADVSTMAKAVRTVLKRDEK